MKRVLTIAGSDSGGGAGIQADVKTITVLGAFGTSVITALTAQNTLGVHGIHWVPVEFIKKQMDVVLEDIGADAVKTGMLGTPEIVRTVAEGLRSHGVKSLVVDPVMMAKGGHPLLSDEAGRVLREKLLPLAFVVTPNIPEAFKLTGIQIRSIEDMERAARSIAAMGPQNVVVKGGHLKDGEAVDILFDGKATYEFKAPRIHNTNTHGTGCNFSAALATFLAQGNAVAEAVRMAKEFVSRAIAGGIKVGSGIGPANPYAEVARWKEREEVLDLLNSALEKLQELPLGHLIPEVRSNLGFAVRDAVGAEDVAAIPGRITQIGRKIISCRGPSFGASRHIAKVILAAMRHDPECRAAMNIKFGPEILSACREAGLVVASFHRGEEPPQIKEMEGSTLEWGTDRAISSLGRVPDVIYDEGDLGKEPMIRILGKTPSEVVEKLRRIGALVK